MAVEACDRLYLDNIESWIEDDRSVVTYKRLCRVLGVNVNVAKQMLYEYFKAHEDKVHASYYVVGVVDGKASVGRLASIVYQEQLADVCAKFSTIETQHIYSIQPARPTNVTAILDTKEQGEDDSSTAVGGIVCTTCSKTSSVKQQSTIPAAQDSYSSASMNTASVRAELTKHTPATSQATPASSNRGQTQQSNSGSNNANEGTSETSNNAKTKKKVSVANFFGSSKPAKKDVKAKKKTVQSDLKSSLSSNNAEKVKQGNRGKELPTASSSKSTKEELSTVAKKESSKETKRETTKVGTRRAESEAEEMPSKKKKRRLIVESDDDDEEEADVENIKVTVSNAQKDHKDTASKATVPPPPADVDMDDDDLAGLDDDLVGMDDAAPTTEVPAAADPAPTVDDDDADDVMAIDFDEPAPPSQVVKAPESKKQTFMKGGYMVTEFKKTSVCDKANLRPTPQNEGNRTTTNVGEKAPPKQEGAASTSASTSSGKKPKTIPAGTSKSKPKPKAKKKGSKATGTNSIASFFGKK